MRYEKKWVVSNKKKNILNNLREKRESFYQWRRKVEALREPPPAISKEKIESLSKMYWEAEEEREEIYRAANQSNNSISNKIKIVTMGDNHSDDLPSLQRLKRMVRELTEDERIALLALSWFTRGEIANWPAVYEHARDTVKTVNENYIAGLGSQWLPGYVRWATKSSSQ